MHCKKEQALLRISFVIDAINNELENGPDISDIDDSVWTEDECNVILENNLTLLKAIEARNSTIAYLAKQARERANNAEE